MPHITICKNPSAEDSNPSVMLLIRKQKLNQLIDGLAGCLTEIRIKSKQELQLIFIIRHQQHGQVYQGVVNFTAVCMWCCSALPPLDVTISRLLAS